MVGINTFERKESYRRRRRHSSHDKRRKLVKIADNSSKNSAVLLMLILAITAVAVPMMLSLEGDFKVEDFLDENQISPRLLS